VDWFVIAACPACSASPANYAEPGDTGAPTHQLYLPTIHCAGCIQTVESTLRALPGIEAARVNLSLRRVAVTAPFNADPTPWIDALAGAGIEAHEADLADTSDSRDRDILMRLGVAGFAMMNVMLLSVAIWSGATDATRDLFHWISGAIAIPAAMFSAQPFFKNAWAALGARRVNMDVPISLAILLALGMSVYETSAGGEHAYFDAALSLTFFLLAGRVLDQRMRTAARSAAQDLAALEPRRAIVLRGENRESTAVSDLAIGDEIWLAAGGRVPVEARLTAGSVQVDRSLLTGESDPIRIDLGDTLYSGDVTLTGPITATVTTVGEDTMLRSIMQLVARAESAKSRYSGLADRAARAYVPIVHLTAFAAFAGWLIMTGDVRYALNVAVATLIITCPCALGLAVPAVAAAATGGLFRRGLLVKSDTALERLASIDTVVFDKTGTLTRPTLTAPDTLGRDACAVLKALAMQSDHPLSKSLVKTLGDIAPARLGNITEIAGTGVQATYNGETVRLGRGDWIGTDDATAFQFGDAWPLHVTEHLLPGARGGIEQLEAMGLSLHVLTGDNATKADALGRELGLTTVIADVGPKEKLSYIEGLQAKGHHVLMVGDGLNDVAALTAADAAISPGTALEASRSAADVVLVSGQIELVSEAITTAKLAHRLILQNFGLAAAYNMVAIPLAVCGFASPLMAALAMSTSSITVTLNALRAR
jgi:Cu2+-exporting ATPase